MPDITGTVYYRGDHVTARMLDADISIAADPHDSAAYVSLQIPGREDDYVCYTSHFHTDPPDAVYRWLCEQWAPGRQPEDGDWQTLAWQLAEDEAE